MKRFLFSLLASPALLLAEPAIPETDPDIIDRIPTAKPVKKTKEKADTPEEPAKEPEPEKVSTHLIDKGGTLGQISEKAYGRTRYWRILKLYNKCDPDKLKVGQVIKAPELPWLLESCGFQAKFPTVADGMLKIRIDLIAIEDAQPDKKFDKEALARIDKLATLIGELQAALKAKTKGVKMPPYATLKQLRTCRTYLNRIAAQKKSGRKDAHALAHEHLSNAMVYSVLWAKAGFR